MIETERLLIRKPRFEDAPGLLEAFADPEAMRFIGEGSTTDLAGAEEAVGRWLASHAGTGVRATRPRRRRCVIGRSAREA